MLIPTKGIAFAIRFYLFAGPLAQLVEQQTLNLRVEGSIPSRLKNIVNCCICHRNRKPWR